MKRKVNDAVRRFTPNYSSPPWATISELMAERDMDQQDVAFAMCDEPVAEKEWQVWYLVLDFVRVLSDDEAGKSMLTCRDMCRRLAKAIGGTEQFWFNRFENHRKWLVSRDN